MQKRACHPVIVFLQRVWFKVGIRAWTTLKYNYKRNRNFISELQGTAWNWGGWWELIGVGREKKEETVCDGKATCPSGATLGRKMEMSTSGRWGRRWVPPLSRDPWPSQGIWSCYLLWEQLPELLQPHAPIIPPPPIQHIHPISLLIGPWLASENAISGEFG